MATSPTLSEPPGDDTEAVRQFLNLDVRCSVEIHCGLVAWRACGRHWHHDASCDAMGMRWRAAPRWRRRWHAVAPAGVGGTADHRFGRPWLVACRCNKLVYCGAGDGSQRRWHRLGSSRGGLRSDTACPLEMVVAASGVGADSGPRYGVKPVLCKRLF